MPEQTKQRRGRAVLDAVLDATLDALAEHGYGFSVDDVARAAGVHKTTVYRRWETKAVLVAAAARRLAVTEVPIPDTGDAAADLGTLAAGVGRALRGPVGRQVLRAVVAAASEDPELVDATRAFFTDRYAHATTIVERGQRAGQLRDGIDAALLWQAMVNPLHMAAICGTPADEATAGRLVDQVLDGAR